MLLKFFAKSVYIVQTVNLDANQFILSSNDLLATFNSDDMVPFLHGNLQKSHMEKK